MVRERILATGFGDTVTASLEYDDQTREILGVKLTDISGKAAKPRIKWKTTRKTIETSDADKLKSEDAYYMVEDEEFGHLVPPAGFEIDLNLPFG